MELSGLPVREAGGSHRSLGSRDSISSKSSGEKKTRRPTNLKKVWVQKYGGVLMLGDGAW